MRLAVAIALLLLLTLASATKYYLRLPEKPDTHVKPEEVFETPDHKEYDENGIPIVRCTAGNDVVIDLPAGKNGERGRDTFDQWLLVENELGRKQDKYRLTQQNEQHFDDGLIESSFKIRCLNKGDEILSFVLGDMTKLDDAEQAYYKSGDFDMKKMDALLYTQAHLIVA